jgi:26S proteasome regulatory subunit N3
MGEIPERSTFKTIGLERSLKPYFHLTQAVRVGDLAGFNDLLQENKKTFVRDRTFNLIVRLRHNVIKAGLRKISLSYSRISIADITRKLSLDSEADAEYVIAKAIHDGAMDAIVDREHGFIYSKENVDVYSSGDPAAAFHRRVKFCLDIHNEAVKAMRFPDEREDDKDKEDFFAEGEVDVELIDDGKDGDDDFMD